MNATTNISSATTAKIDSLSQIEFLTAPELAGRLKVKPSWVVEQTKPSRTSDPIPVVRFGRHNRYAWGSRKLTDWISRRFS